MVETSSNGNGMRNGVRGSSQLERTVQHVLQGVLVLAVVGLFIVLGDLRTTSAVTKVEVTGLREGLVSFRIFVNDRYTAKQAQADWAEAREAMRDHEQRIRSLEQNFRQPLSGLEN